LDIVNPTDWTEFNQNAPADARIPVWMVNAEKYLENGGNVQLIVSQAKENKIAGLNADGDANHPFIMKGVDAITGQYNGFRNVTPALAGVATSFNNAAALLAGTFNTFMPNLAAPLNGLSYATDEGLLPFAVYTVDAFNNFNFDFDATNLGTFAGSLAVDSNGTYDGTGAQLLSFFAQCGFDTACSGSDPNANLYGTNLMPANNAQNPFATEYNTGQTTRTSAFEMMPMASFSTFNTFSSGTSGSYDPMGSGAIFAGNLTTRYTRDYPSDLESNFGARFKNSTANGLNYSVNYFYGYDSNPSIDLSWHDATTKAELSVIRAATLNSGYADATSGTSLDRSSIKTNLAAGSPTTILLTGDGGTSFYGAYDPLDPDALTGKNPVELLFTEKLNRTHSLGGSFDYAIDSASLGPVVLRGEFVYQKDVMQPVVDNLLLGIGDLTNSLSMEKTDMFKYVIGADVNVLTDMMVSGQFIQFRNLDFKDTNETCSYSNAFGQSFSYDCSRYTADFPTMSLTNGLQKAEKNKNFYSLFLTKPFGESGEGRWGNIFIYEEGGGKWNRFDVEYGFDDQLIGTFEVNKYFGDNNTMFGQFENASNIQVGLKYLLQ
jgi:hypothetical protein